MLPEEAREKYSDDDQLRIAAENGDPEAQFFYGMMFNLEAQYSEAVKWFKKSAAKGEARAMAELGMLYYKGLGVEKNITVAIDLINKAFSKQSPQSLRYLDKIYEDKSSGACDLDIDFSHIIYAENLSRYAAKNFNE